MTISRKQIYNAVIEAKNKFGYGLPSTLPYYASERWCNNLHNNFSKIICKTWDSDNVFDRYPVPGLGEDINLFEGVVLSMGIGYTPVEEYNEEDYYLDENNDLCLNEDAVPHNYYCEDGTVECQVLYSLPGTTKAMEECEKLLVALGVEIC